MGKQDLVTLAKLGNPQAIAVLLNQALRIRNITAQVVSKDNRLHILLEAHRIPDREAYVAYLQQGLNRLQIDSIHSVRVYARLVGEKVPAWDEAFKLNESLVTEVGSVSRSEQKVEAKQTSDPSSVAQPADLGDRRQVRELAQPSPSTFAVGNSQRTEPAIATVTRDRSEPEPVVPKVAIAPKAEAGSQPKPSQFPAIGKTLKIVLPSLGIMGLLVGTGWDLFRNADKFSPTIMLSTAAESLSRVELPKLPEFPSFAELPDPIDPLPKAKLLSNFQELSKMVETSIPATSITIKAVGDIIPGTNFPSNKLPQQEELLFQSVSSQLQGADIVFGNFESTLTDHPYSAKDVSRSMVFAFRTPPSYVKLLKEAGFNVLNVANNHSMDFTDVGFEDTIRHIEDAGMKAVGKKNEIVYKTVKTVPVAFIGFSTYDYHNTILELEAAKALVEEAKKNATIVVISFHAGAEGTGAMHVRNQTEIFYGENRGNLVEFSRAMIDAGADLVLGHGPHVPRALELYKGKLIAYSLGNFMGYRTLSTQAELGYSLILQAEVDIEGNFTQGKIIPVHLDSKGIPYIDQQFRTVGLMRNLTQSDFPQTQIAIDGEGNIVKQE